MSARRALTGFRAPDEPGAEGRAWEVVRVAYQERLPAPRRAPYRGAVAAFAAALVLAGALALSPAGATVSRLITRALGVQHAAPAVFALPARGRLLVSGAGGTWTVAADGATRRLGPWTQASWSPHGLYVTVVGRDELAAVDPRGTPQWTLARPDVRDPQWFQPTGYRVAYLAGDSLRVVAGDGTGDHLLDGRVQRISPAWRPSHPYQLAYVAAGGRLVVREADSGRSAWSAQPGITVDRLAWSFDGARLLALGAHAVRVYSAGGVLSASLPLPRGAVAVDGALSPDGHAVALVLAGTSNDVLIEGLDHPGSPPRRVLSGVGLGQVAWSPDARWLLVSWPAADQWVFIRVAGAPRIAAVSRIARQFSAGPSRGFPRLEGWCCTDAGPAG